MRNHDAAHAVSPGESFSRLLGSERREDAPGEEGRNRLKHAILIVDDKPELLNSLHQLIGIHGYEADKALGGAQALEALATYPDPIVAMGRFCAKPGMRDPDVLRLAWGALARSASSAK